MKRIIIERFLLDEEALLMTYPDGASGLATIFFLHGFTSDKSQSISLGYALAEANMAMVAFDAPLHGEHFDGRAIDVWGDKSWHIYPSGSKLDGLFMMFEIIEAVSSRFPLLIDKLGGDERLDLSRLGVCGYSMGGFAAYHIISHFLKVKAAALIAASPFFTAKWQDQMGESLKVPGVKEAIYSLKRETKRREEFISKLDPAKLIGEFAPKPLLMMNGDMDQKTPKEYSIKLYDELKPLYKGKDNRLKLHLYTGTHHGLKTDMVAEAVAWFSDWL